MNIIKIFYTTLCLLSILLCYTSSFVLIGQLIIDNDTTITIEALDITDSESDSESEIDDIDHKKLPCIKTNKTSIASIKNKRPIPFNPQLGYNVNHIVWSPPPEQLI